MYSSRLAVALAVGLVAGQVAVLAAVAPPAAASVDSATFVPGHACGDGTYTVPASVHNVEVTVISEAGHDGEGNISNRIATRPIAGGKGGLGAKVTTTLAVTPGQVLKAFVASDVLYRSTGGEAGQPAGHPDPKGRGGNGGLASWVSSPASSCDVGTPLVMAGGGGGGGGSGSNYDYYSGGAGGSAGSDGLGGGNNGSHHGGGGLAGNLATGVGTHGAHGYGLIQAGWPVFVANCQPGYDGDDGLVMQRSGNGGLGAQLPTPVSKCGGVTGHGYHDFNTSGGGGGGGAGYVYGGGGGGASDERASGGGGGSGASWSVMGSADPIATTESPSITITPVRHAPIVPSFGPWVFPIGQSTRIDVAVDAYPAPQMVVHDLPPGIQWFDHGDGTGKLLGQVPEAYVGSRIVQLEVANSMGRVIRDVTLDVAFGPVATAAIEPNSPYSIAGYPSQQLTAVIQYTNGYQRRVTSGATWTSSDPTLATVSSSGVLTPLLPGPVTITAVVDGRSIPVTFPIRAGAVQSLVVSPSTKTINLGETFQYAAALNYTAGPPVDATSNVTWTTSDPSVATISATGLVTAVATRHGDSTAIFASYLDGDGRTITSSVSTFTVSLLAPTSVAVTPAGSSMAAGTTQQLTATGTFLGGATADVTRLVTWTSSDTELATVGADTGLVQTRLNRPGGSVVITAAAPGGSPSATASIGAIAGAPAGITVTPSFSTLGLGQTRQMTARGNYGGINEDITNQVTWSTDDAGTVSVSPTGVATATGTVNNGSTRVRATLTAPDGSVSSGDTLMTVSLASPSSIAITPLTPTVAPSSFTAFTAVGTFPGGTTVDLTSSLVTWSSSNTSVGAFSGPTLHVGNAGGGSTVVTATSLDGQVSASTLVTREIGNPTSLTITPDNAVIGLGATQQYRAIAGYVDGSTVDVTTQTVWGTYAGAPGSMSASGLLTATRNAYSSGTLEARYTSPYGGQVYNNASFSVTLAHPTSIAVTPAAPTMLANKGQQFTATGTYPGGTTVNITNLVSWSGGSSTLATVYASGNVITKADSPGGTFGVNATSPDGMYTGSTTVTGLAVLGSSGPAHNASPFLTLPATYNTPFTSAPLIATGGSGNYGWTVDQLPAGLSLSAATGASVTITGTPTLPGTTNFHVVLRDLGDPTGGATASRDLFAAISVAKLDQAITSFTAPAVGVSGTRVPFTIVPGPSGGTINYTIRDQTSPNRCYVSGQEIVLGLGDMICTVEARQNGNAFYNDAPMVELSISMLYAQAITWYSPLPNGATVGSGPYALSPGGTGSGAPIVVSLDPATTNAACELGTDGSGHDLVYARHAGTCVVSATQLATGAYAASPPSLQTFTVGQAAQSLTITSSRPTTAKVGGSYGATATATASGIPVTWSVAAGTTNAACSVNGNVFSFDHVGTCVVAADQAGSADYTAATQRTQSFTVAQGNQSVSFTSAAPTGVVVGNTDVPTATGTTSGNPVVISIDPTTTNSACRQMVGTVFFDHRGSCVLAINQAGSADWTAAPTVRRTIAVAKAPVTLAFASPAPDGYAGLWYEPVTVGSPDFSLLSIHASTTPGACDPYGTKVKLVGAGTCVLAINRPADNDHLAAPEVLQAITVHDVHLAIVAPPSIDAGNQPTNELEAFLIDADQQLFAPAADVNVHLDSTSPGAISSASQGGSSSADVVIPAGSPFGFVYYGDSRAGTTNLTLSDATGFIASTSLDVQVVAGATSALGFAQQPTDVPAGVAITPAVSVQVTDAFGNAVVEPGVTVTLTSDHGTLTAGAVATTDAAGLATFDQLTVADVGTYQLSATSDTGLATPSPSSSFAVRGAPTVGLVEPAVGPTAGNDVVTISGSGFDDATDVRFGGVSAVWFYVSSDQQLVALTPAHVRGAVDVTVVSSFGTSVPSAASTYTYSAGVATTIALTSGPNPRTVGDRVTISAQLKTVWLSPRPTGTVQFLADGTVIGSAPVDTTGKAVFATTDLPVGDHVITAHFGGDPVYGAVDGGPVNQRVSRLTPTVRTTTSLTPAALGQAVTLRVAATGVWGRPVPTGQVTFLDGSSPIGTATLDGTGAATLRTSSLASGDHVVTVSYDGDARYAAATSAALTQTIQGIATNALLTSSVNPSVVGRATVVSVVVSRPAWTWGILPVPAGSVTFSDGTTVIGTTSLNDQARASVSFTPVAGGDHTLTATYVGNASYAPATSAALVQSVGRVAPTVAVTSSVNPSPTGTSVVLQAQVTRPTWTWSVLAVPSGSVTFYDGAAPIGSANLTSQSRASLTVSSLGVGNHSITAVFAGDAAYAAATSAPITQAVGRVATSLVLSSSLNPAGTGAPVVLQAVLKRPWGSPGWPTGAVAFFDGVTPIGSVNVDPFGVAKLTTSTLAGGPHAISAVYAGDAVYAGSTAPGLVQTVSRHASSVSLSSPGGANTAVGDPVQLVAHVVGEAGSAAVTGTVTFRDGTAVLGSASVDASGDATLTTSAMGVGSRSLTATYEGDTEHDGATSLPLSHQVAPGAPMTITASSTNVQAGELVTFTVNVNGLPDQPAPTGLVLIDDGGRAIWAYMIPDGNVFQFNFGPGVHVITAAYQGDANYPATSVSVTVNVAG